MRPKGLFVWGEQLSMAAREVDKLWATLDPKFRFEKGDSNEYDRNTSHKPLAA